jgi:hypothetical protein
MTDFFDDLRAEMRGDILLGRNIASGRNAYLSLEDMEETSVHIVGAAGVGKSYYLRHLIDQFVIHGQPFGLIDPHRELYEYALWRLRRAGVAPSKLILVDPSDRNYAIGFNPLSCGISDPSEAASMVLEAFLKAWGAKSFDETPRMEGILRGMFRLLIESRLTLLEGYDFLNVDNVGFRKVLRERVSDRLVRQDWAEIEKSARPEKLALLESSRNRLRRVLHALPLQMMLAQNTNTLNFRQLLDKGQYLLANLGGIEATETQRLIGALLVNGIFHAAKQRDSRRRRDWFLICDEFGEFATRDFANSLDQLRKFGVHLVLAHQRLRQLEREDSEVLSAVMTNAKIKVVFGGLERPEAERMARELFTGQARGDRIKHIATQTKFRPVTDTFDVESETWSTSDSDAEVDGWSRNASSSLSDVESEGATGEDDDERPNRSRSRGGNSTSGSGESGSRSRSRSRTSGSSRSRVPFTRHEEFVEETGRQFWSLDEEWERLIGLVHGMPKRQCLVKVYNRSVIHIATPDVDSEQTGKEFEQYREMALKRCPHVKPVEAVVVEMEERRKELAAMTDAAETVDRPFKVKSFRE